MALLLLLKAIIAKLVPLSKNYNLKLHVAIDTENNFHLLLVLSYVNMDRTGMGILQTFIYGERRRTSSTAKRSIYNKLFFYLRSLSLEMGFGFPCRKKPKERQRSTDQPTGR